MVYIVDGNFLVFESKHARLLRRNRIVGNLIGCSPKNPYQISTSNLPLHLSKYEVDVTLTNDLAKFVQLVERPEATLESYRSSYLAYLDELAERTQVEYRQSRVAELNKRNIPISDVSLRPFDTSKLRIPIPNSPDARFSIHAVVELSKDKVNNCLDYIDESKRVLFRDLYDRGFYITSGLKYGSDFLVYLGDPVGYHAQYAVRLVASDVDGNVDLTIEDFNEINALYRLCHTANKVSLLATITSNNGEMQIEYWTLRYKDFLTPLSKSDSMERHDPKVSDPEKTVILDPYSPGSVNKMMRT